MLGSPDTCEGTEGRQLWVGRVGLHEVRGNSQLSQRGVPEHSLPVRGVPAGQEGPVLASPPSPVVIGAAWEQPVLEQILGEPSGPASIAAYLRRA